ncbi:hypothetical protein F1880_002241 [Penicillium rolfsii]|nr:hypothetical protein F1880_002241 [Penicillium rolfsii]
MECSRFGPGWVLRMFYQSNSRLLGSAFKFDGFSRLRCTLLAGMMMPYSLYVCAIGPSEYVHGHCGTH